MTEKNDEIDPILQALSDYEEKKSPHTLPARQFAIRHTWLANDSYLPRLCLHLITLSKPKIPGIFRKTLMGLLKARLSKKGTYNGLRSQASFIQLKLNGNRLRSFYLPDKDRPNGLCFKIIPKKNGFSKKTADELSFRKKLSELDCITLPQIVQVEEDEHFLYISEELIQGERYRHYRHASLFAGQGITELCAMYKAAGIHYSSLDEIYPLSQLETLQSLLTSSTAHQEFLAALKTSFRINPDIPVGACHNDLLPSNLCVADGKLYFFDWEMVSEGPIMADLLRLPFKYEKSGDLIDAVAQAMKSNFSAADNAFQLHFTAYVAERIIKNTNKKEAYLKLWSRYQQQFAKA